MDGVGENGVLNVFRNQTLDVNVAPIEVFDGDLNLFQNSTFDWAANWTLATGTIDVNNGFINGVFPLPDVPAGVSIIDGGALTQTGGTITVVDADGTLRFNTGFVMTGGTFTNNGLVIFDGDALIDTSANFKYGWRWGEFDRRGKSRRHDQPNELQSGRYNR